MIILMGQAITGMILPDPSAGPCRAQSSGFLGASPAAFLAASRRPSLLEGGMSKVELFSTRDHV